MVCYPFDEELGAVRFIEEFGALSRLVEKEKSDAVEKQMERTLITMGSRLAEPKTPNRTINKKIDMVLLKLCMVYIQRVLEQKVRLDGTDVSVKRNASRLTYKHFFLSGFV